MKKTNLKLITDPLWNQCFCEVQNLMNTISFEYPEEKIIAIKIYLNKKSLSLEDELLQTMDNLYEKQIPANVREFIELKGIAEIRDKKPVKRAYKRKISQEASAAQKSEAVEAL